jgi:hypothetical protein
LERVPLRFTSCFVPERGRFGSRTISCCWSVWPFLLAVGQLLLKAGVKTVSAARGKVTLPTLGLPLAVMPCKGAMIKQRMRTRRP